MSNIKLTGIFDRILTEGLVKETWGDQVDRLVSQKGFTHEAAERICAIAEHLNCIRMSEKVEYLSEIFDLGLQSSLAGKLTKVLEEYYK